MRVQIEGPGALWRGIGRAKRILVSDSQGLTGRDYQCCCQMQLPCSPLSSPLAWTLWVGRRGEVGGGMARGGEVRERKTRGEETKGGKTKEGEGGKKYFYAA